MNSWKKVESKVEHTRSAGVTRTASSGVPLLFVLLGCDPAWSVQGRVTDKAGTPLESVHVTLSCFSNESFVSDASGQLDGKGYGSIDRDCVVRYSKPGFRAVSARAYDMCQSWHSLLIGGCRQLDLSGPLEKGP